MFNGIDKWTDSQKKVKCPFNTFYVTVFEVYSLALVMVLDKENALNSSAH